MADIAPGQRPGSWPPPAAAQVHGPASLLSLIAHNLPLASIAHVRALVGMALRAVVSTGKIQAYY